jgi:succinate dehydrogenase flavin-adding protein (antitoxin of CptAB toxin-antitoxin module)
MKRQSRRRLTRRRKQRGGAEIDCRVIVFSNEELSEKTKNDFKRLLETLSKGDITLGEGGMYKYTFVGETGLPEKYQEESVETVFIIENPPSYLSVKSKSPEKLDAALTKLEYKIRDAMGSIPLKLIPGPHGLYNSDGTLFYVGIMPT